MNYEIYLNKISNFLIEQGVAEQYADVAALVIPFVGLTSVVLIFVWLVMRCKNRKTKQAALKKTADGFIQEMPPGKSDGLAPGQKEQHAVLTDEQDLPKTQARDGKPVSPPIIEQPVEEINLVQRLHQGLSKTRSSLLKRFDSLFSSHDDADASFWEELEEILISADFGMKATQDLVESLGRRLKDSPLSEPALVQAMLKEAIQSRLSANKRDWPPQGAKPIVIMVVGVNGVGKTTTIGKLAKQFADQGKKVVLGAGDTFRAAAAEQLSIWGDRSGADVIQQTEGSDPAAVAFDAAKAAVARKADVLILDTAGRLHTKINLMEELKKVKRVISREIPGAPHETLLVLDATTGQNALIQAKMFQEAVEVTGIALTKLDGTAKGGIVVAISSQLGLPVQLIGIGETVTDLRPFDAEKFVEALLDKPEMA
jgi:fused signal recognition particle receptor